MLSELLYMRHRRLLSAPMSVRLDESPGWLQLAEVCLTAAEGLSCDGVHCVSVARRESRLSFRWHFDRAPLENRMRFAEITRWAREASGRLCWVCGEKYGNECDLHRWRI